ncbi:hypothetical protein R1sor_009082 [Riccia sorocarpa]|uniref:CCHC-type domain-containing protein n=1 Tax=Riccia sorocarpa TaxID=122646 RepID=A0ABD3H4S0_9MARC
MIGHAHLREFRNYKADQDLLTTMASETTMAGRQCRILEKKRTLEDCGLMNSLVDQNIILANGPYYMKRCMYITPWEPGFNTNKVLCWLDLVNVDPLLESEAGKMLESLGSVIRMAGVTTQNESKFSNVRGCLLLDMTKPLLTALKVVMNAQVKRIKIQYDLLPDACFMCHERGHFAKICPLLTKTKAQNTTETGMQEANDGIQDVPEASEGFQKITGKRKASSEHGAGTSAPPGPLRNPFDALRELEEDYEKNSRALPVQEQGQNDDQDDSHLQQTSSETSAPREGEDQAENTISDLNSTPILSAKEKMIQHLVLERKKESKKGGGV